MKTQYFFKAFKSGNVEDLSRDVNDFVQSHQWKELTFYPVTGFFNIHGSNIFTTSISGFMYVPE